MKITIELEAGLQTGAMVGILGLGITKAEEILQSIPDGTFSAKTMLTLTQSIVDAKAIRDEIDSKVNALSGGH